MTTANGNKATITATCLGGHEWEWKSTGRGAPKYCPAHRRFIQGPISGGSQPKARVIREWEDAEENLVNERGYANRWLKFWRDHVRIVAARAGTWKIDKQKYEEWVRESRYAELHRLFAQDQPYITSDSGAVKAHPGWRLSAVAQRKADKLAVELGLKEEQTASRARAQGASAPSKLEQEAEELGGIEDDQVGPDGEPL